MSQALRISTACVGNSLRLRPFGEAGGGLRVRFRGSRVAAAAPEAAALVGLFVRAAGAAAASTSAISLVEFVLRYGLLWRCSVQAEAHRAAGLLRSWIFFASRSIQKYLGDSCASSLQFSFRVASQSSQDLALCAR